MNSTILTILSLSTIIVVQTYDLLMPYFERFNKNKYVTRVNFSKNDENVPEIC